MGQYLQTVLTKQRSFYCPHVRVCVTLGEGFSQVQAIYVRRPSPEYARAFDQAADRLNRPDGAALAVVSSPVHAVELLKRCTVPLALCGTGAFDANTFAGPAVSWAQNTLTSTDLRSEGRQYSCMLWAEPEELSAVEMANRMAGTAVIGTTLDVIVSAPLRRFLPEWRKLPLPAEKPIRPSKVIEVLRAAGWQVEQPVAFHGPRSMGWNFLARAAGLAGRPDWSDRCLSAMQTGYREPGWLWPLAHLVLIRAQLG